MVFWHALEGLFSIIIMVSVGYFLTARGWFNQETAKLLPRLVNYVALPTYMVWNLLSTFDKESFLPLLGGVVVPAVAMLLSFGVAYALAPLLGLPVKRQGTFRSSFFCSSAIFVGLPVNIALFGEASIPYVLIYFLANAFLFWTIGNYSISLDGAQAPAEIFSLATLGRIFSPPLLGFVLAVSLLLMNVKLPAFILHTAKYLGSMTIPLSMLFIGMIIFGVQLKHVRLSKDMTAVLAGRFFVSPLMILLVAHFFPIPAMMKKVFVIQSALPVMTQTTVLAKLYGADAEYAALLVSSTTVCALIAIPVYMILV